MSRLERSRKGVARLRPLVVLGLFGACSGVDGPPSAAGTDPSGSVLPAGLPAGPGVNPTGGENSTSSPAGSSDASGAPGVPGDPTISPTPSEPGAGAAGGGAAPMGTVSEPSGEPVAMLDCSTPLAPRSPMRRLTRFEYDNTVRDLLLVDDRLAASTLPAEEIGNGFSNDADALGVSRILIDGYRSVASALAGRVAADASSAAALAGCDPAADEMACRDQFIASFGARAFRRPLASDESGALTTVFTQGQALGGDFAGGVRAVVEASLQMPQFLYRPEFGEVADLDLELGRPTSYEMASRLSYLLWASMPDPELLDAAAQDALVTREQVAAQAMRMIDDEKARDVVVFFHRQRLGLPGLDTLARSAEYYPTFEPGMGLLFREETERFVDHVVWEGGGDFASLLTAPYSFMNETLATFYGVGGVTGDEFVYVDLDPNQRAGFVTQAGVMALTTPGSRTNPIVRSKWLLEKLLCQVIPDPPVGLMIEEPEVTPGVSTRERFAQHRDDPTCATCHDVLDPVGFAFENFDGVGLWRDMDNGVPVDPSGEIAVTDVAGPFTGPIELLSRIAASQDARSCYVRSWLAYGYGLSESSAEACTRQSLENAFVAANGNIKQLLVALTQTDTFLHRPLPATP